MTKEAFAPKDAETLKTEILEETGLQYEGNEEVVDKLVARGIKDEAFKASLHGQKTKVQEREEATKERLKKAGFDPETGERISSNDEKPAEDRLSTMDILALRDVETEEDLKEIEDYAKFKGISRAEAKKSTYIQSVLKTNKEYRATAQAASTNTSKRTSKESTESLVSDFHSGKVPETQEDIDKLVEAEFALKRKRTK